MVCLYFGNLGIEAVLFVFDELFRERIGLTHYLYSFLIKYDDEYVKWHYYSSIRMSYVIPHLSILCMSMTLHHFKYIVLYHIIFKSLTSWHQMVSFVLLMNKIRLTHWIKACKQNNNAWFSETASFG
eukprot:201963_1